MFVCHPENDSDKLDPETTHSEGLATRIYRPQPGPSCQFPEMLSMPGEAIYRGDVTFLLNVKYKGVQFGTPFPSLQCQCTTISEGILEDFRTYTPTPYWLLHHMVIIFHKHFSFGFICTSFLREFFIQSNLL